MQCIKCANSDVFEGLWEGKKGEAAWNRVEVHKTWFRLDHLGLNLFWHLVAVWPNPCFLALLHKIQDIWCPNTWDMLILKNLLFIWNWNFTGSPVFLFALSSYPITPSPTVKWKLFNFTNKCIFPGSLLYTVCCSRNGDKTWAMGSLEG